MLTFTTLRQFSRILPNVTPRSALRLGCWKGFVWELVLSPVTVSYCFTFAACVFSFIRHVGLDLEVQEVALISPQFYISKEVAATRWTIQHCQYLNKCTWEKCFTTLHIRHTLFGYSPTDAQIIHKLSVKSRNLDLRWGVPILLCCSLMLKCLNSFFPSSIYTPYPTKTKLNHVPACGKLNSLDMIWKSKHRSIEGLTANNAHRSKNQAMRSKEQPAELRGRVLLRHRSADNYKKLFCCIEGSREHSGFHNSEMEEVLEQPRLFLEMAAWPNRANGKEGCWYESSRDWATGWGWGESWTKQCTEISLRKTWSRALSTSDWARGSLSNRSLTLGTQPRQCRSG